MLSNCIASINAATSESYHLRGVRAVIKQSLELLRCVSSLKLVKMLIKYKGLV